MKKEKYYQQVHKDCGGEIIIVACKKDWSIICKSCSETWKLSSPIFPIGELPKEFENVKDGVSLQK